MGGGGKSPLSVEKGLGTLPLEISRALIFQLETFFIVLVHLCKYNFYLICWFKTLSL